MSRANRAAQFAPFAALTGYEALIQEEGRLTEPRSELSEEQRSELDWQLARLTQRGGGGLEVILTFFEEDARKDGGQYKKITAVLKKINHDYRTLEMETGECIPFSCLRTLCWKEMEGESI